MWKKPEADFLDKIQTKGLIVFLLAIHRNLCSFPVMHKEKQKKGREKGSWKRVVEGKVIRGLKMFQFSYP